MLKRQSRVLLLAALFGCVAALRADSNQPLAYPPTPVDNVHDTLFGVSVADPYRWLEDAKNPKVQEWMAAEDKLARDYLAKLPGREPILKRLKELAYVEAVSAPLHRGNRYFYTRRHADREKSIVYWKEGKDGKEQVLLDPNTMSADGTVSLGVWVPSYDGKTLAFAIRRNNSDEATLHVRDVASGAESKGDEIEGAKYAEPSWTPEGDGFYYVYLPTDPKIPVDARPGYAEARFHKLGTDPKNDPVVHPKTGDPATFLGIDLSRDGRWLFAYIQHGWNHTDVFFRDLKKNETAWRPFRVGQDALYQVTAWKDHFYIATNEQAPRYRVFRAALDKPERADWQEIIPEAKDAVLESAQVLGEHLVLVYLQNATNRMEIADLDGKRGRRTGITAIGSIAGVVGNPDEDDAYCTFTSFTVPNQVYELSVRNGESKIWASVKLPIDPKPYTVEQVWYPSKDGTKISMFLVHRKDLKRDGSTPWLLTGYGGFNVSMTPSFIASLYPWMEAGGGFALPNLRGGGEYGEEWHRAGMLHKKQNVFDDFLAAAEYLVKEGYTKPEKLAIRGGSNGGLLMGAALTQRPDLFRAVICEVPLLDMLRYQLFGSGRTWIPEYGTAENEADFKTLVAYSPYHHVKKGTKYPAVLMMSSDSDDRVDPMHARKMVAALQAASTSRLPILLRIEKHAGHGGADLIKQQVEQAADRHVFLMKQLEMTPPDR